VTGLRSPAPGRFVAFALLFAGPAAAFGAPPLGSRLDPVPLAVAPPESHSQKEAIRVMHGLARCVGRQKARGSEALLALPIASAEQGKAARRLVGGAESCMGTSGAAVHFESPALAGGLAEQLVLDRYSKAETAFLAGMSDQEQEKRGLAPRNLSEDFGLCVLRRDPATVRSLIETKPAEAEEGALIRKLIPHFGPCAPASATISFEKPAIRTLLAYALYRALSTTAAAAVRR
jgi:hypothetical protein